MKKIAIVGFGCAGFHCVKALRENGSDAEIHVFGDGPPANPMLTTYYVSGKLDYEGMFPFGTLEENAEKYKLSLHMKSKVAKVHCNEPSVTLENGEVFQFDEILLATGALPFSLPLEQGTTDKVFYMRTPEDAVKLKKAVEGGKIKKAVVIGASMVGIKVAELFSKANIETLMVDGDSHIFPLSTLPEVAQAIEKHVEKNNVVLKFSTKIKNMSLLGESILCEFENGSALESDAVVLCIGSNANMAVIDKNEIETKRGIVVDEHMQTSCKAVYAAGDCCEAKSLLGGTAVLGLFANAAWQGRIAGECMCGKNSRYTGNVPHNITHFMDRDFIGIGDNRVEGEPLTFGSLEGGGYIKAIKSDGKIACLNILGFYNLSGIVKAHMLKRLEGSDEPMSPRDRGLLKKRGLSEELIDFLDCKIAEGGE